MTSLYFSAILLSLSWLWSELLVTLPALLNGDASGVWSLPDEWPTLVGEDESILTGEEGALSAANLVPGWPLDFSHNLWRSHARLVWGQKGNLQLRLGLWGLRNHDRNLTQPQFSVAGLVLVFPRQIWSTDLSQLWHQHKPSHSAHLSRYTDSFPKKSYPVVREGIAQSTHQSGPSWAGFRWSPPIQDVEFDHIWTA